LFNVIRDKCSHAAQSSTNGSISHIQIDRDILESDWETKVLSGWPRGPQVRIRLNYETIMIWFSLTFSTINFCVMHANGYPHATMYRSDRSGPAFDTIFSFRASLANLKNSTIDKNFRARELWNFLKIGRCRILY